MRFRLGMAVGFGIGYYLGAKAGRERYEELNRMLRKLKRSEVYETATSKAREVIDLGVDKAKEAVGGETSPDDAAAKVAASRNGTGINTPPPFPDARP